MKEVSVTFTPTYGNPIELAGVESVSWTAPDLTVISNDKPSLEACRFGTDGALRLETLTPAPARVDSLVIPSARVVGRDVPNRSFTPGTIVFRPSNPPTVAD